jgi:hypothetical protein
MCSKFVADLEAELIEEDKEDEEADAEIEIDDDDLLDMDVGPATEDGEGSILRDDLVIILPSCTAPVIVIIFAFLLRLAFVDFDSTIGR